MKHYIIILGFISVLTSCAPSKYFVEAEEILAEIDWTQNLLNYIPLTNDDLQSDILNTTYSLLKSKKHSQLKRYLSTVQDSSDYCLAKTLYCISKAYSMYLEEVGFPAQTTLSVIVRLRKRDELVFEKRYFVDKTLPAVPSNNRNIKEMQYAFVTNMAESLSLGTKECIEQIIRDINLIINTH